MYDSKHDQRMISHMISAIKSRDHYMIPGSVGLPGFHQPAASGFSVLRHFLLQQALWLGLGQLHQGSQYRQGSAGQELDEAHLLLCGSRCDCRDLHRWPCQLPLEVIFHTDHSNPQLRLRVCFRRLTRGKTGLIMEPRRRYPCLLLNISRSLKN